MISHTSRAHVVRKRTVTNLQNAGVYPYITLSTAEHPSDAEVKRVAWYAATGGLFHPDGVLFFEDDLLINKERLKWFLEQPIPKRHDLVILCLLRESLYPRECIADLRSDTPTEETRIVPLDKEAFSAMRGFHGSMAMWLSPKLVETIFNNRPDFMEEGGGIITHPKNRSEMLRGKPCGFDFWLKDYAESPAVVFPNPVDHAPEPSVIKNGAISTARSPSFYS
jgi:hypothetical protein